MLTAVAFWHSLQGLAGFLRTYCLFAAQGQCANLLPPHYDLKAFVKCSVTCCNLTVRSRVDGISEDLQKVSSKYDSSLSRSAPRLMITEGLIYTDASNSLQDTVVGSVRTAGVFMFLHQFRKRKKKICHQVQWEGMVTMATDFVSPFITLLFPLFFFLIQLCLISVYL